MKVRCTGGYREETPPNHSCKLRNWLYFVKAMSALALRTLSLECEALASDARE